MSGVEKFMVEKSGVEKFPLALGLNCLGLKCGVEKSFFKLYIGTKSYVIKKLTTSMHNV